MPKFLSWESGAIAVNEGFSGSSFFLHFLFLFAAWLSEKEEVPASRRARASPARSLRGRWSYHRGWRILLPGAVWGAGGSWAARWLFESREKRNAGNTNRSEKLMTNPLGLAGILRAPAAASEVVTTCSASKSLCFERRGVRSRLPSAPCLAWARCRPRLHPSANFPRVGVVRGGALAGAGYPPAPGWWREMCQASFTGAYFILLSLALLLGRIKPHVSLRLPSHLSNVACIFSSPCTCARQGGNHSH